MPADEREWTIHTDWDVSGPDLTYAEQEDCGVVVVPKARLAEAEARRDQAVQQAKEWGKAVEYADARLARTKEYQERAIEMAADMELRAHTAEARTEKLREALQRIVEMEAENNRAAEEDDSWDNGPEWFQGLAVAHGMCARVARAALDATGDET
jgi:hypothetical protein